MRTLWTMIFILALGLSCYKGHGLSPTAMGEDVSGIQGHLSFVGQWPDSTREVRVAVLQQYPKGMSDADSILVFVLTNLVAFSDTIPRNTREYDFELVVEPDIYAWILVAWFPDNPLYLFGVKELGAYYKNPNQREYPTPVSVIPGTITRDIDMVADFANVNSDRPFFKKGKE